MMTRRGIHLSKLKVRFECDVESIPPFRSYPPFFDSSNLLRFLVNHIPKVPAAEFIRPSSLSNESSIDQTFLPVCPCEDSVQIRSKGEGRSMDSTSSCHFGNAGPDFQIFPIMNAGDVPEDGTEYASRLDNPIEGKGNA
jgi:hypothetical protein